MKRIAFMALLIVGIIALCLASICCYMPPTPTPHPGQTVGPGAGATSGAQQLGLPTPGITIPALPSPQVSQPAMPPPTAFGTPAFTAAAAAPGLTRVAPAAGTGVPGGTPSPTRSVP